MAAGVAGAGAGAPAAAAVVPAATAWSTPAPAACASRRIRATSIPRDGHGRERPTVLPSAPSLKTCEDYRTSKDPPAIAALGVRAK